VTVVPDVPAAFADAVVSAFQSRAGAPSAPFVLLLSGGPTARRCYEELARRADAIDWSRVVVAMGDERRVCPDDPEANELLVRQALLERVPPVSDFVSMLDAPEPRAFEQRLADGRRPDVVHLGLGPDGHTASLFAGSPALWSAPDRLVVTSTDPTGRNPWPRLTLTFAGIARAHQVLFTVVGHEKAAAFAAVRRHVPVPAALVRAEGIRWLVDPAAAGVDH
jgi:6-phosphogluconolactonase